MPSGTRRLLLDAGLVALVIGSSLLLSADVMLHRPAQAMLVKQFGSVEEWRLLLVWWWVAAVPTAAAVFLRHRRPVVATALAVAGSAGHVVTPFMSHLPSDMVPLITLYTLAGTARTRRVSVAALVAVQVGLCGFGLAVAFGAFSAFGKYALVPPSGSLTYSPDPPKPEPGSVRSSKPTGLDPDEPESAHDPDAPTPAWWDPVVQAAPQAVVPALLLGIAWAAGDNARTRRAHLATLEARAADLRREQEQLTALAVAAERGRITRELHDVVAHGLSVMVIQAQGAQAALRRHPERSEAALANVIVTGRASLAEMRRLLGLVRAEPGAELTPQPGLATLPELIEQVRAGGTPVAFHVTGEPAALPAGVELSAYRIIQEALTNILKHAGPDSDCTVDLGFTADRLRIRVRNSGTRVPVPVFGNGLRGIAERVTALGGTLHAGPGHEGGFEVSTVLPLEAPA